MPRPYYTLASLDRGKSVGYLVKRCGELVMQLAERRFERTAVTFTQWQALIWLSAQDSHLSATQLSEDLGHDMGALTRVVDQLERRGLVRRERSRHDRRAVEIAITAAGRRQALAAKRVIVGLNNALVAPYSDTEIATLIALLQRLLAHLQRAAARFAPAGEAPPRPARPARAARREPRRKSHPGVAV